MSSPRRFSETELKTRLRSALRSDPANEQLSVQDHYARFATTGVAAHATAVLEGLDAWPCDLYSDVSAATREQVLNWLIENARRVSWLERERRWLEQWYLERLLIVTPTPTELVAIAKTIENRTVSAESRRLYACLQELDRTSETFRSWLRHLVNSKHWSDVITSAAGALEETTERSARSEILIILVDAHLQRGRTSTTLPNDGEQALHLLFAVRREGLWETPFDQLLERSADAALPSDLKIGRGEPTSLLADAYRGLGRAGKWFGKLLGGREAQVPYSDGVVKSAPATLTSGAVEELLARSEKHSAEFREAMKRGGGEAEAATVAGALSIGGFWTLSQIDATVLSAMTFASRDNPESFWRLREIADGAADSPGAATRLSGYVAEQQVAVDLAREGHVVEFPNGPAEPGWDLLVDGHPVQVKCSMDADYVLEHFETYPDIPVVVNAELAEQLGDHPMILVDAALSHAEVASMTDESIEALAGFADADDLLPIPFLSVAFATFRNFGDLDAGRIDRGTFAERVGVDAAARTVGGGAGSILGGALGSVLGPVGAVVGASIGGFVGSVAGGTGADAINHDERCDARDAVVAQLWEFATWFLDVPLRGRVAALKERHHAVSAWAHDSPHNATPTCVATFFTATKEMLDRATALEAWIAEHRDGDDFARAHAGWVALREAPAFFHPEMKQRLAQVQEAMRCYTQAANTGTNRVPSPANE